MFPVSVKFFFVSSCHLQNIIPFSNYIFPRSHHVPIVPQEGYNVGVDSNEQNLRHHVSMTQLIGYGKKGMNKQELKEFICNEIDNGSPPICLEHFMQPRNNVELPDLPPETRKRSTKRKRAQKIKKNNASGKSGNSSKARTKGIRVRGERRTVIIVATRLMTLR